MSPIFKMSHLRVFLAGVLLLLLSSLAFAQDGRVLPPVGSVVIIVNSNNLEPLSQKEIKAIFLGRRTLWAHQEDSISVVLQPKETPASKIFNREFFSDEGRRLTRQWIKNVVIGAAPAPITLKEDNTVLTQVQENINAIGYVLIDPNMRLDVLENIRVVWSSLENAKN